MINTIKKVAVLGGGSFGTVIANLVASNGSAVSLYVRDKARAEAINQTRINDKYLPDFILSDAVTAVTDLAETVTGADLIFISVPSKFCREVVVAAAPMINDGTMLVSTTKGIEAESLKLMSQVIGEILPKCSVGVLSGPNLASQIAQNEMAGAVIASDDERLLPIVADILHSPTFRVYSGRDVYGVELGGALKNIYAIMFGMAKELGIGENTQGLLLTRSLAEMSRFAVSMGADPQTFIGLAGVGDLFATCMSPLSRNYRVGQALARGQNLDEIVRDLGQVAEGVNTLSQVKRKADTSGIYMPLATALYDVLHNDMPLKQAIANMTVSSTSKDVEFVTKA